MVDENNKPNKSLDAGTANLSALSLQVNGIGNEINDFLDNTIAFVSLGMTNYDPESGHQLLGSTDSERGYSYWLGVVIPDLGSQIRYTHLQHDYTPSIRCAGWVAPKPVDIEADDIRFFIRYTY
ncbi:MAG: hypothetical protein B6D59_04890 [Campylobacteraceae bacterium 4484_4]|nr:MAG: hypothetical protein B6D59_04890 [Campylobacteraceae bacterium 4484_4]